mgnify:CR=1 FL=1
MHEPVLLKETFDYLDLKAGGVALDATLGGGGHSREMLKRILPGGRLIGIDADQTAIDTASSNLKDFEGSFKFVNGNFRDLDSLIADDAAGGLDAALFDLGISSYQMDDGSRGFSMRYDAPLDMRMDRTSAVTARDLVNRLKEDELADIISRFGEERFARRIARRIAEERSKKTIETTIELASMIRRAVGSRYLKSRIDPATRTFQALRIAVNDELTAIEEGIKKAINILKPGGRICVISFHSLEDRIAKNIFRDLGREGIVRVLTKKPIRPGTDEVRCNARSRSAKMRAAERIR